MPCGAWLPSCAALPESPPASRALTPPVSHHPVSRPPSPVPRCLVPDHHLSAAVSVDLQGGSGPACCCHCKKKQATDKTSTTSERDLLLSFFSTTRERQTQKGRRPRVRSFLTSRAPHPVPVPVPVPIAVNTLRTVPGCLASRFPLARSRGIASPSTSVEKGGENSAPVEFPEFHLLSRPRPDQDERAAGETDD